jgi:iron complex transport system substrate-binding protein
MSDMEIDEITGTIVDIATKAHRRFGPNLLESFYEAVLTSGLRRRGLRVERQRLITVSFDDLEEEGAFRADLLVEDCVIVEIKSVERRARAHAKQLLTYLRRSNLQVGLLLNFGCETMKEGIERMVNNYTPPSFPVLRVDDSRSE